MENMVVTYKELTEDEKVRMQMEAREDNYRRGLGMSQENRTEDLLKAAEDPDYRQQLFDELGI